MKNVLYSVLLCLLAVVPARAEWEKTNFPTSMPNKMAFSSDGHLVVGEFSEMYSTTGEGGLYVSPDLGESWTKVDMPNYNFASFVETEDAFYAFGDEGNVLKTEDFETWETLNFAHLYEEGLELTESYASAYYKGRIYCAPLGMAPVYSEDGGKTWALTDGSGLDLYGGVWLYSMLEYKGKLYACGGDGIFCLNEDMKSWTCVEAAFFAMGMTVYQDKLFVNFDVQGSPYPILYTENGTDWVELAIPEDYVDQNSVGSVCVVGDMLVIGSLKGIFYTQDLTTWNDISAGFPIDNPAYTNPYVKPTCMVLHGDYVYASAFDASEGKKGGLFKLNTKDFAGLVEVEKDAWTVRVSDNLLTVSGTDKVDICVYNLMGCEVYRGSGREANLSQLECGTYIYVISAGNQTQRGKFMLR